jgi:hypothetical protein
MHDPYAAPYVLTKTKTVYKLESQIAAEESSHFATGIISLLKREIDGEISSFQEITDFAL